MIAHGTRAVLVFNGRELPLQSFAFDVAVSNAVTLELAEPAYAPACTFSLRMRKGPARRLSRWVNRCRKRAHRAALRTPRPRP